MIFFLAPTNEMITVLTMPECVSFIQDTIMAMNYQVRDKSVERALIKLVTIGENWVVSTKL